MDRRTKKNPFFKRLFSQGDTKDLAGMLDETAVTSENLSLAESPSVSKMATRGSLEMPKFRISSGPLKPKVSCSLFNFCSA